MAEDVPVVEEQVEEQPTPEQIEERKQELLKFYTEEMPLLQARFEYEELVTKIEETRFARFQMMVAKANMAPPAEEENEESEEEQPTERKLKQT